MRTMSRPSVALLFLAFASPALAQDPVPPQERKPQPERYQAVDQVAIESFTSEPATIPAGTMQVQIWVVVKNVTNARGGPGSTLNGIGFRVLRKIPQPDVLELGSTIVNLAPGATQRMGARINIAPGTREYLAQVDWDNALHEAALHQINNSKKLVLTIPKTPVRP
jgi:hypothetical protein